MEMIRDARIIASAPGRLRIGVPGLYRSPSLKQRLEAQLGKHGAVLEVCASELTGRILLLFRTVITPAELLAQLGIAADGAGTDAAAPGARAPSPVRQPASASMYPPWHLRDAAEALAYHGSSDQRGLSRHEAAQRLLQGKNVVALPKGRSSLDILLSQFKGAPILLLGLSAAVSLVAGALAEAAAIGAVLVMNAVIGFSTERQAEATITSLSELVDDDALVVRDGAVSRVDAADLVPGDVVKLGPGARIAADMRLVQARALKIDESALTGESLPVEKQVAAMSGTVALAERHNMVYRGTAVASGSGLGVVVGIGSRTEAGAVEELTRSAERPMTPIQAQLDQLGTQLVVLSAAMCLAVVAAGLLRGHARAALFRSAIALAVAAIPEGLPAVATTSLVRGLLRMRRRGVLIRHLHAVETIGTISTICLDKTGTLTMNRMTAVSVCTARHRIDPEQAGSMAHAGGELERLLQVCVLSSEAEANHGRADTPPQSSPTEAALLALAQRGGIEPAELRRRYPLVASELRAEGRNYMRSAHATPQGGQMVAVKGSPAEVLALCAHYLVDGQLLACDQAARALILRQNDTLAQQGLRVLGFAYAEAPEHERAAKAPLAWLGLVGLADPLRPGVARTIERFHEAGIRTTILTGDQAGTAAQIGTALRLNRGGELNIVNADQLAQLPPEQWRALAADAHVFSRVTPSDKLRIVKALQAAHATVAMTGDGINDSPAMRAADVGIAMGSGTGVALSAADVALQHDQLDALLEAVAQGRSISDNIRKAVHFLVSSNLSEILVVFGAVACAGGAPLNPLQLLWLNLLTDVLPAIALAEEAPESDVMQRAPRDARAPLVGRRDMLRYAREAAFLAAGALGAFGSGVARHGEGARASTIAFDALVLGQLAHAVFCRSERPGTGTQAPNPRLTTALGAALGLQLLAHLVPGLRRLLRLTPLGPLDLLSIVAGAGLPLLANRAAQAHDQSSAATSATAERSTSVSTSTPTSLAATPFDGVPSPGTCA